MLLIDSNIDWGQDLRALVRYHGEDLASGKLRLAYFGSVPPEFEGATRWMRAPRALPPTEVRLPGETETDPTSFGPQPGRYAVSVNFERGLPFHTPCPLDRLEEWRFARGAFRIGPMLHSLPGEFAWFRRFTPTFDPRVGWSILFFDISFEQANEARSAMGMPPLPAPSH
jgi:hypothetical protein